MKKRLLLTLSLVVFCLALSVAGCAHEPESDNLAAGNDNAATANGLNTSASSAEDQYLDKEDVRDILDQGDSGYLLLDLRKAIDYQAGHIATAVSADINCAIDGTDDECAIANLQTALEAATGDSLGGEQKLVLICYSGRRYAAKAADLLQSQGVDASRIYILSGGYNGWIEEADYLPYVVSGTEPGELPK